MIEWLILIQYYLVLAFIYVSDHIIAAYSEVKL